MRFLPVVVLAGCSMYGAKPAPMAKVATLKHVEVPEPPPPKKKYVEACVFYGHEPGKVVPQRQAAAQRVSEGDAKVAAFVKAPLDTNAQLMLDAIARYSMALKADPYDADATLHLALAYDQTQRKGCAIKLLDRLSALAKNPKLSPKAPAAVNDVQAHTEWFRDYRSDADDAVQGLKSTP